MSKTPRGSQKHPLPHRDQDRLHWEGQSRGSLLTTLPLPYPPTTTQRPPLSLWGKGRGQPAPASWVTSRGPYSDLAAQGDQWGPSTGIGL